MPFWFTSFLLIDLLDSLFPLATILLDIVANVVSFWRQDCLSSIKAYESGMIGSKGLREGLQL